MKKTKIQGDGKMQLREYRPADCRRLEMLFLAADERGVGLGRQMLECACGITASGS